MLSCNIHTSTSPAGIYIGLPLPKLAILRSGTDVFFLYRKSTAGAVDPGRGKRFFINTQVSSHTRIYLLYSTLFTG
jgi:hypothetical protein